MAYRAEDQDSPVDVNVVDLVDMSKAFVQTAKTIVKPGQFSQNKDLKVHGGGGHEAISSKLSQVHSKKFFAPQDPK